MTHFVVLVIGENPEEQLDPFWELDLSENELKEDKRAVFDLHHKKDDLVAAFEKWKKENPDSQKEHKYRSAIQWAERYEGLHRSDNGDWGNYYNPKAKWDWYQIGGRWTGYFKLKPGAKGKTGDPGLMTAKETRPDHADQARVCDIDWDGMVVERRKELEKYVEQAGGVVPDKDQGFFWFTREKPKNVEGFYESAKNVLYPRDILKDGQWYSQGEHGWWGMFDQKVDDQTWEQKVKELLATLLATLPPETLLTLFDCHI